MISCPIDLAGVFPPVPTPFADDGKILFDRLETNLSRWNEEPLAGYVVGGSNGEFPLLSFEERVGVVRAVRRWAPAERLVIAGSGAESSVATIALTEAMADAGADAAIVVTPGYYRARMTPAALVAYYTAVADRSPLPVILYNVPANTGVDMAAEVAVELSRHPKVIGIKDSAGDVAKLARVAAEAQHGFQVLAGSAGFFLAALAVGAVGAVPALANVAPGPVAEILRLYRAGDGKGARRVQASLVEVNLLLTSRFGVPGLKCAMDLTGRYGGPPRLPLLSLAGEERELVRGALRRSGLLAP